MNYNENRRAYNTWMRVDHKSSRVQRIRPESCFSPFVDVAHGRADRVSKQPQLAADSPPTHRHARAARRNESVEASRSRVSARPFPALPPTVPGRPLPSMQESAPPTNPTRIRPSPRRRAPDAAAPRGGVRSGKHELGLRRASPSSSNREIRRICRWGAPHKMVPQPQEEKDGFSGGAGESGRHSGGAGAGAGTSREQEQRPSKAWGILIFGFIGATTASLAVGSPPPLVTLLLVTISRGCYPACSVVNAWQSKPACLVSVVTLSLRVGLRLRCSLICLGQYWVPSDPISSFTSLQQ